jgi:hypothetical protein
MVQLLPPGGGMLAGSSSSSGHAVQQRTTTTLHAPAANGRAACLRRAPARRCSCPAVKVEPSSNEGVRLQAPARHGSSWGASSSSSLRAPTDAAAAAPPDSSWSSRLAFERLYHLSSSSSSNSDAAGGLSSAQDLWLRGLFLVSVDDKPRTSLPPPQKGSGGGGDKSPDYYANVGDAIRTLREDIPLLFKQDLNCERGSLDVGLGLLLDVRARAMMSSSMQPPHTSTLCGAMTATCPLSTHAPTHIHADEIYRDDITFRDPRNSFTGMKNYQLIFWSLRFHGRIFFSSLYVEVRRIWQPSDGVICMRWTVHGVPRVPWEAEGTFDGISKYTLDSEGKIYEHAGECDTGGGLCKADGCSKQVC